MGNLPWPPRGKHIVSLVYLYLYLIFPDAPFLVYPTQPNPLVQPLFVPNWGAMDRAQSLLSTGDPLIEFVCDVTI